MAQVDTRLPLSKETRDKILFQLKEPGESYDDVIRRLCDEAGYDELLEQVE